MHPSFKLFLGNQRITANNATKSKMVNAKSYRMRTHNVTEQSKDLSARQHSLVSCEMANPHKNNKAACKDLIEKLSICLGEREKELANGEKRHKAIEI